MNAEDSKKKWASFFLRMGIAFSFIYVGVMAFSNPSSWIGFIPLFIENFISRGSFLIIHGIFNLLLGVWLLSNWKIFYASLISVFILFSIFIFNLNSFDIVFRDISILLAAIALGILSYEK